MEIVEKARMFAIAAHSAIGQTGKYTHEPYWVHPAEVVGILKHRLHDPEMLAAGWLHDVVEDTQVKIETIGAEFGPVIRAYVGYLTDSSRSLDGNRASRKEIYLTQMSHAPAEVKTVKVADIISNISSIVDHDPAFAKVYLDEVSKMLEVLTDADPVLLADAHSALSSALRLLQQ